jgi:hypothetical protein
MGILTPEQRSALYGRLLGLPPSNSEAVRTEAPERIAPTGTVAGTEPMLLGSLTSNRVAMLAVAAVAIVGVLWLARKVL